MLYNPPTGGAANDPYVGKNPAAGIQGSKVPPPAVEFPQRELVNVIEDSGQSPTNDDLGQTVKAIRSGKLSYWRDTGTADALAITPARPYTDLSEGTHFAILKGSAPNATTTPTLDVNGLILPIVKEDGSALAPNDLPGTVLFEVRSDGSKLRVKGLRKSDTAIASGEGIAIGSGQASLNFPGLGEQDAVVNVDLVPFYSVADAHHRKTTFANFVSLLASALTNIFVPKPPNAAAVSVTYGMSGDQSVASNTNTQVALTGGTAPFCSISGGAITISTTGLYLVSGTLLGNTNQPLGQLQYSSLLIVKNGALLTQTTISNYSFGSVLVALNVTDGAYLATGDVVTLVFYTHAQANNDTGDSITASGTSFTLVKVG